MLQSDPIVIEIDGEVHKFRHNDRIKGDVPAARKSVMNAISFFRTQEDFDNLRPLLEGVHYAGCPLGHDQVVNVIRRCGTNDRIHDIIECARKPEDTGIRLASSEIINELLHQILMRAFNKSHPYDTAQSLRWSEMVIEFLAEDAHKPRLHRGRSNLTPGELPLDRDPQVLLARLRLAAVLARDGPPSPEPESKGEGEAKSENENDVTTRPARKEKYIHNEEILVQKTRDYAQEIVRLWPEGRRVRSLQPAVMYEDGGKMKYLRFNSKFATLMTPLLHGLDAAIEVLGSTPAQAADSALASQLRSRRNVLNEELREAYEDIKDRPWSRGLQTYQSFYGPEGFNS